MDPMAVQYEALPEEVGTGVVSAGVVLTRMAGWLDRLDPERSELAAQTRLEWAKAAREVADRAVALAQLLVAEADRANASLAAIGTPMSSWLSINAKLSKRESTGVLHRANALADHPRVGAAAAAGRIGAGQARAITDVLGSLEDRLDPGQRERAEQVMVGLADRLDADGLARAAGQVLAEVAPATAEELVEERLQREAEAALRSRSLVFSGPRDGSVAFRGSLPRVDAEAWMVQLDAYAQAQRRTALERRDPLDTNPTPEQRRADALAAMIHTHSAGGQAPSVAGDRPRVVVTLDYEALRRGASGAGLIADGVQLSAGELRRLCCDADLLPAVLGTHSEVLDIGRATRRVPPAIRAALVLRDGGCVFPGCHTRPSLCDAHHLTPWYQGGPTALSNLALLCRHHHGLVEPATLGLRDQWLIQLGPDGTPEAIPPRRQDPDRKPIRHQRFLARPSPEPQGKPPEGRPDG